ncbi:unnamed protein product [Penicillium nalgiovense]|uniref:Uncharacterized protein n=1 Tax=Penicillium nalgiovense TaxID=60175 RepID=A0A1V6YV30_PENNA|nr:hypothetical protein PENNAL_c0010G11528 [Penicillium nalgiovense]CAG8024976.1 unnamed protein product [Penicillium nalgiovense]CAG8144170.1 unnamed protein product [Penicillium nalgiovense]CAG8152224.1 unnamed protein product [Penicillium nalgiovense]CAG8153856.1 unnamed protein product [Penicillium nalgiovense]
MTNEKNTRGNPASNQSSNTPAPTPSPSTSNNPSNQPPPNPAPPSLATRIQTSATGLAKSAFNPSPDLAQTLASSTSSKQAGPSTLANTQTSRDLPATTTPHGGSGSASGSVSASAAQGFREHDTSTPGVALPALTEDEFQHGHGYERETDLLRATTATNTQQSHEDLQTPSSTWKGKARAHDPTQHQFETIWQRQYPQNPQTTIPATDGAAVVSLLSDTNFDPNFEDPTTVPDTEIDIAAAPGPLSAAEKEALDSFRRGLGLDEEERSEGTRLTATSLVPDIDVFLSQGAGSGIGEGNTTTDSTSTATATSLRDAVLTKLPGAGDWLGVQERYHDEVWGFLQPVLEEARAEIEEKRGEEGLAAGEDGPAVRRLKMILMHMKG